MRKLFKLIHLYLALPAGLLISIICLTGAILVFEKEVTRLIRPSLYEVKPPSGAVRLQPSVLIPKVRSQISDTLHVASLQYSHDAEATVIITFSNLKGKTLSVDPYTAEVKGWIQPNSFFPEVRKLHRWLLNAPAERGKMSVGKMLVGLATSLFVFIILTGIVIWIPRSVKGLRNRLTVATHKGRRRFLYDSHVSLGFYASLFLLLMALTGLTWSFGWYRNAAYALLGASAGQSGAKWEAGARTHRPMHHHAAPEALPADFDFRAWDRVWAEVQQMYPQFEMIELGVDRVQVATNPPGYARRLDYVKFNTATGEVTEVERYANAESSRKVRMLVYSIHTGMWGGYWTKTLYFIAALIGACLPLTGYYLWWVKRRPRRG